MTVFLSYSSRDKAGIQPVLSVLGLAREQVWWDQSLGTGSAWWTGVVEQIRQCDVFILAVSQNSLNSRSCRAELQYAQQVGKPVLPVQIGHVEAIRATPFAATQVLDYRKPRVDTGIQLIEDLRRLRASSPPLPDPLPPDPPMPYAYLMRLTTDVSGPILMPTEQVQMLAELKTRLNEDGEDASARGDIARLLFQLRDRADTTPDTRAEIDSIVEAVGLVRPGIGRFNKWMLAGVGALLVVATAVAVAVLVSRPEHGSKLVTTSELGVLLLTDEEVPQVLGRSDFEPGQIDVRTFDNRAVTNPPKCLGAFYNASDAVYKGSGYTASRNQPLKVGVPQTVLVVYQSAIRFSSHEQAKDFVRSSADNWKACANQPVQMTEISQPSGEQVLSTWKFAPLHDNGLQIVQTVDLEGGDAACQHVLRAEANVIIEVNACGGKVTDEAEQIAAAMAAKMPQVTR